jgi:hypothetical protein
MMPPAPTHGRQRRTIPHGLLRVERASRRLEVLEVADVYIDLCGSKGRLVRGCRMSVNLRDCNRSCQNRFWYCLWYCRLLQGTVFSDPRFRSTRQPRQTSTRRLPQTSTNRQRKLEQSIWELRARRLNLSNTYTISPLVDNKSEGVNSTGLRPTTCQSLGNIPPFLRTVPFGYWTPVLESRRTPFMVSWGGAGR